MVRRQERPEAVALPPRPAADGALVVDADVVLDALAAVAAAGSTAEVAAAPLRALVRLRGVRAALVVQAPRRGADPVVLASAGYDCSSVAAGAVLPADAGLPVTETARTGRTHVVGTGPSWVAVPAGDGGALLLSLSGPPPDDAGVARLERLGQALGPALGRAHEGERSRTDLLVLEESLAVPAADDGVVVLTRPYRAPLSGDVVELVADGEARWLLVADVCGRGAVAAVGADRLRAAFRACAPGSGGPVAVLRRLDTALQGGEEDFATALVARVEGGRLLVASAGHPAPLLVPGGRVALRPAPPLGLGLTAAWSGAGDVGLHLADGTRVVVATDGLVDRGAEVDLDALVAALPADLSAAALAQAVLAGCEAAGPAQDDASLAVLTVRPEAGG